MTNVLALAVGTELVGDYRIDRVLGAGGFGITYLADEISLGRSVTIKEYFPSDFAARADANEAVPRSQQCAGDYKWGLDRFIEEAQTLARFDHPNIVRVFRYFRANNTGYMVLGFEEGQSLKAWMKGLGRAARQKEVDRILAPMLAALEYIHAADYLHRDIAPDNIIIRNDGSPVLIDFGSARGEIAHHTRTLSALVKPGYSPYEQYAETGHRQGPWTDIYALGATLYHLVCGKRPPDSPSRVVKDDLVPAKDVALSSYRAGFLAAIDRALALETTKRPQSIAAWRGDLLAPDPAKPGWLSKAFSKTGAAPAAPTAAPAVAKEGPAAAPPPPDAPGQQGGILDFFEGLKRRIEPAPSIEALAAPQPAPTPTAKAPPEPAPAPKAAKRKAEAKPKAKSDKPERPKREKPVPAPRARGWRLRAAHLLIATLFASAALLYRDKVPRLEIVGSSILSSGAKDRQLAAEIRGHKGGTSAVAFTEDGKSIATTGADGTLKLWNAASGGLVRTLELDNGPALSLALFGRRAVTGHADGTIALWELDRADKVASFKRNGAQIWSVAFAGEPTRVVASSHDWSVALWDARTTNAPVHVFEGHDNAVQAVAFSSRGPYVASGSADRTIKLWSLASQSIVRTYRGHKDFVTALAFAGDGRVLASASLDGGIRVWSAASGRLIRSLSGHKQRVGGLAFAPSGDHLASAGDDGTVKLWELRSGRLLRTFSAGGSPAKALAFAPDGKRLAAAGEDGIIRLFEATVPQRAREE